jgi:hypothetical protein
VNRRIGNRTYGGVRAGGLRAPGYSINYQEQNRAEIGHLELAATRFTFQASGSAGGI